MKPLILFPLMLLAATASFSALAKEMPVAESGTYRRSDASVLAPVAFKQPNRIYIENAKITRAVGDTTLVQLDPDPSTGSLYVIPLSKDQTGLFVVSDNGQTHSITIAPKERITSQTIVLKDDPSKVYKRSLSDASHAQALPYEARVQEILRAIPSLSEEHAEKLSGAVTDGYLTGNPVAAWSMLGLRLERYHLVNRTEETLTIREPAFYHKGVIAVATEADSLAPKASTDLWLIRETTR